MNNLSEAEWHVLQLFVAGAPKANPFFSSIDRAIQTVPELATIGRMNDPQLARPLFMLLCVMPEQHHWILMRLIAHLMGDEAPVIPTEIRGMFEPIRDFYLRFGRDRGWIPEIGR